MKIIIWGTGRIAEQVYRNGIEGEILGFLETVKKRDVYMDYPVFDINTLPEHFDWIIVANRFSDEIYEICKKTKMNLKKVIFLKMGSQVSFRPDLELKNILGEKNYTDYLGEFGRIKDSFFEEDRRKYEKLNARESFAIYDEYLWPVISDKYAMAGAMENYFWQDLWAAKYIISDGTKEHYDIGSRVDGFIAHLLASNIKVNMIDIRPFPSQVDHLYTIVDDATMLKNIEPESLESISALCSLEHFGLGRYGDEVDPEACFKCFEQIQNKLKKGGKLYISVPVGRERVEFNAHRVFYASTIRECFHKLELLEFSCAAEGRIEYDVDIHKYDDCFENGEYRYGLFRFQK
ncbi:DUF268 domain-containing protein [Candidatus Merdisoma sp. JLR.KK011]|jgi:hypothetical protein|uniref:DUF268 domain-containing protein n=1 Tax=Candidatus Merdisoma sp. JLR.KK011 TaxID=3114299 RepID=UPI002FF0CCCA